MSARGIALFVVSAAVPACTFGPTDCTLLGYQSAVRAVGAGSVEIIDFCINDVCLSSHPSDFSPESAVPVADDPAEYTYRLTFSSDTAEEMMIDGTVETEEYRANGPGCDPVTANATLTVDDNGDVEVSHP